MSCALSVTLLVDGAREKTTNSDYAREAVFRRIEHNHALSLPQQSPIHLQDFVIFKYPTQPISRTMIPPLILTIARGWEYRFRQS